MWLSRVINGFARVLAGLICALVFYISVSGAPGVESPLYYLSAAFFVAGVVLPRNFQPLVQGLILACALIATPAIVKVIAVDWIANDNPYTMLTVLVGLVAMGLVLFELVQAFLRALRGPVDAT
jgi:hypothetical protein